MNSLWMLPVIGLVAGLLTGWTGIGTNVIGLPALLILTGLRPAEAVGSLLVVSTVTRAAASWRPWRQGSVSKGLVGYLLCGSLPSAVVGALWVGRIHEHGVSSLDMFLTRVCGGTVALLGVLMLMYLLTRERPLGMTGTMEKFSRRLKLAAVAAGVAIGFVTGFTSVGVGVLAALFLLWAVPISAAEGLGTNLVHAAIVSPVAGAVHLVQGTAALVPAGALLVGTLPGAIIGVRVLEKIPERKARILIAVTVGAAGLRLALMRG